MRKLIAIGIILVFLIVGLSGCLSPEDNNKKVDIHYQTFYSNNLNAGHFSLLLNSTINISQSEIDRIVQDGEVYSFQIEYPVNWSVKYYMGGLGIFPLIFFPNDTNLSQTGSPYYITFDLLFSTVSDSPFDLNNILNGFDGKEYSIDKHTKAWIKTGSINSSGEYLNYNNYNQGLAYISYKDIEIYHITSYFTNNNSSNIEIFNHMVKSFKKV